jgi:hypothetical protein
MARVFKGPLPVERLEREVTAGARDLYLVTLLMADDRGRLSPADMDECGALLERGTVGYDRLADGPIRVWYRETGS